MTRLPDPGSDRRPTPRPVPADGLSRAVAEGRRRQAWVVGAAGSGIVLTGLLVLGGSTGSGGPSDRLQPAAPNAASTAPEPVPGPSTALPLTPSPMEPSATLTTEPSPPSPGPSAPVPPPTTPSSTPPAPPPSDPGAELWGRQFTAFERTRAGQPDPFVEGTTLEVQFASAEQRSMSWRADCNSAGAELNITPDRLLLGPIGSTAAGCDEARERQDSEIGAFFAANPTWRLARGELVLTSGEIVIRLRKKS